MPIQTDKEVKANKPAFVIKDKKNKECMLIDIAVPSERSTSIKVCEKLSKCLEIEISKMCGMKTYYTSCHGSTWTC